MAERRFIRLTVPAELEFRELALRAVAEACRLVRGHSGAPVALASGSQNFDLSDRFSAEMVSAVSEIFNNIAIHSYGGDATGEVLIEMELAGAQLAVQISDHGMAFDPKDVPSPELEQLPEGGMGIHIAVSCVDEIDYTPGPPNVWRMRKTLRQTKKRAPTAG
ncbi:MAG TPA: ATP-binding protein [Kofleriaceae bacterium]|nr:ATP-binding protein [Kofleriaceae bacterium]